MAEFLGENSAVVIQVAEQQKSTEPPCTVNPKGMVLQLADNAKQREPCLMQSAVFEFTRLLKLAAPTVLVYLMINAMSMSTILFCRLLSVTDRSAADNFIVESLQTAAFGLMFGLASAVETVCGQAYGAEKFNLLGKYLQRSVAMLIKGVALPLLIVHLFSRPITLSLYGPEGYAQQDSLFIYGLIPKLFALAAYFPMERFLQAHYIVLPPACAWAGSLSLHLVLTWLVVVKLRLGALAASLVQSLSWWAVVGVLFLYISRSEKFKHTWNGFSSDQACKGKDGFLSISVLSFLMALFDFFSLLTTFLAAALFVDNLYSILPVCWGMTCWIYPISVGLTSAVSARVSNELGAGHSKTAQRIIGIAGLASSALSITLAVILIGFGKHLSFLVAAGPEVAEAVYELSGYLAVAVALHTPRPVISGVILGCGWQEAEIWKYITSFAAGISLSFLGFFLGQNYGYVFLVLGILLGGVAQIILLSSALWKINWVREVEATRKRLAALETPKN